jgi:uncharacterized protein
MRVIMTGGTGSIGVPLAHALAHGGHEVIMLSRDPHKVARLVEAGRIPPSVRGVMWDTRTPDGWGDLIDADTAIINLAGENVGGGRWTQAHKARVLQSRLDAVNAVAAAIQGAAHTPRVVLQASAVGIYGSGGDALLVEESPTMAGTFPADVCIAWERAARTYTARTCWLRIGIVLDPQAGALPPLRLAARLGVSRLGSGRQYVPWIHVDDVVGAICFLLAQEDASGVYNVSAPYPVTNATLMQTLARLDGVRSLIPAPAWGIRLATGEMAISVLQSQRVIPQRLQQAGCPFRYPRLEEALRDLMKIS